ncbi:ribosomal protein S18 acetylase RimI-like enzyme [Acidovorax soli]|uniref:Ribosomal protein S18 acetylase RimI-like enzyme n=1 Tax=Acidovorax soli TaxID=592050 RepID=A0A7X0U8I4_9BURK|nr:GNAT family N-acetyltransferase [Acidovorax soli]MBB6558809.1 ribosomal protein S18 acetylase RimI-like enzyme [Acidovorax soli]
MPSVAAPLALTPPTTPEALIRALEERAFNAWPARQSVLHSGWVFRLSGGFTKRANSANAIEAGASFSGVRAAAEALYARHGLPAVFRISPLAHPDADRELAEAGYTHFDPSQVMASAGLEAAQAHAGVQIDATPSASWLDGFAAANGVRAPYHAIHHGMVHAIALPCAFASLRDGTGQTIGFGLAVLERGAIGLYDVVVDPAFRGQGHGRELVCALLQWGRDVGAVSAYLQVRTVNEVARRLYAGLGFAEVYGYHYRIPPLMA